jgi:hypothetical protein
MNSRPADGSAGSHGIDRRGNGSDKENGSSWRKTS